MFTIRNHHHFFTSKEEAILVKPEPTNAEKKRQFFGVMYTLHALMNRANIKHENSHTMTCMGYKSSERF